MASRSIPDTKREQFLDALGETANVSKAAAVTGISRQRFYRLRDADDTFAQAWDAAFEQGVDALEEEALRRAIEGEVNKVYYGGKEIGATRKLSDSLLMFLLKALRPERYKERPAAETNEQGGAPLTPAIYVGPKKGSSD